MMEVRLYEIIAASLSNETLTEEEISILQEWLSSSLEHKKIYSAFQRVYTNGKILRENNHLDHCEIWHSIEEKCGLMLIHRRNVIKKTIGLAAGVILIIGLGLWYFFIFQGSEKLQISVDDIAKEMPVAYLELDNGEQITLTSDIKSIAISSDGRSVICDSNVLDYRNDNFESKDPEVTYNKLVVPVGVEYSLVLSDGSRVYVNAASELRYPTSFQRGKREVYLTGEAYFEVQKDSSAQFVVKTGKMDIEVLGTSFNVNAYQNTEVWAATLTSGRIRAVCGDCQYDLLPGHQIRNNLKTGAVEVVEVDTSLYTCWKDGYYYFEACRLEDILQTLSRWYGIYVSFQDNDLKNLEFTGRLRRYEDVSQLFRKFEYTRNVRFIQQGDTVFISTK